MEHNHWASDDGKYIEFCTKKIRKFYPAETAGKVSHIQNIYRKLKTKCVPNVDSLTKVVKTRGGFLLELKPRGDSSGPKSADDVKNAVKYTLEFSQVQCSYKTIDSG